MSLENHLVLYQSGHCGTFLVWLINQHKNFSQYPFQWKYTKEERKLDLGCFGADWNHDDETFAESREEWKIEYNLYPEDRGSKWQPKEPGNKDRTKDAIKIIPNHLCQNQMVQMNGEIDETLLKKVKDEMNPKSIIIAIADKHLKTEILNRWITWWETNRPEEEWYDKNKIGRKIKHKNIDINQAWAWEQLWWRDIFPWLKENVRLYGDNAHTIDIGKIILYDESEYIKLCEIIDEEPLTNIKEIIEPFRNMMKSYK